MTNRPIDVPRADAPPINGVPRDLEAFVKSDQFPCVGAKSALALAQLTVLEGDDILSPTRDAELYEALGRFGAATQQDTRGVASFACLFTHRPIMSEVEFETALWTRIQALHDIDAERGQHWADGVDNDPASPVFSLSINGIAFFVVGLHPGASRPARRFCRPALVFNAHEQFEQLRMDGRYGRMQSIIRERELAHTGSINPMLTDFGRGREAAQYSGRKVQPGWTCPLKIKT
ncbi:MAG: YqcI/YcgG family protein [Alphaproteobacteria bacterium]|nr:MAG: YqcI/YcgG family protein [Alphaproteobacteria bacterium]